MLYSFNASANDGFRPGSGVIQASDGNLYGTTPGNGPNVNKDYGAVFKVTLSGQETLVYTFQGQSASDGQLPEAGLIQGVDGNLYGTTSEGGVGISGTAFKLTPAGVETVLSNFNAGGSTSVNGYSPIASLLQASDGNLYGINNLGGAHNDGTVSVMPPEWCPPSPRNHVRHGPAYALHRFAPDCDNRVVPGASNQELLLSFSEILNSPASATILK